MTKRTSTRILLLLIATLFYAATSDIAESRCVTPELHHRKFVRYLMKLLQVTVVKVYDGDAFQAVDRHGKKMNIRLYGIDAPESSKPGQPYGEEARRALERKIGRKTVRIDVLGRDEQKRLVCKVYLGETGINREMVEEGFAWAFEDPVDKPNSVQFVSAEQEARREKRGLWQLDNPQPPWEYRSGSSASPSKTEGAIEGQDSGGGTKG